MGGGDVWLDNLRHEYIRGSLKVDPVIGKIRSARLSWYGDVMRRDKRHVTRRVINMIVNGRQNRGRSKEMDGVNEDTYNSQYGYDG